MKTQTPLIEQGEQYLFNVYNRFPLTLVNGEGVHVYDASQNQYLDFVAGIAVNCLGHSYPKIVEAIHLQSNKLIHCSNLYWSFPMVELAKQLVQISGLGKVFFCNSGAEAVEAALKLARKYGKEKKNPQCFEIITMNKSFHGRTYGAMTATGQPKYQEGFQPLLNGFKYVDFNDINALKSSISESTCAILLEPIQGEGGIIPADKKYLNEVRNICSQNDILLILDEIQCGIGRTGCFFAFQHFGIHPDIVVLAKGLAGGIPIGAMLASEKVAGSFQPGDHASTFGGNPLACAVANVVVNEVMNGIILPQVQTNGAYLFQKLLSLQKRYPTFIKEIRGIGLMVGVEFNMPIAGLVANAMQKGLLIIGAGEKVIRFVPPLIVEKAHINKAIEILDQVIIEFQQEHL